MEPLGLKGNHLQDIFVSNHHPTASRGVAASFPQQNRGVVAFFCELGWSLWKQVQDNPGQIIYLFLYLFIYYMCMSPHHPCLHILGVFFCQGMNSTSIYFGWYFLGVHRHGNDTAPSTRPGLKSTCCKLWRMDLWRRWGPRPHLGISAREIKMRWWFQRYPQYICIVGQHFPFLLGPLYNDIFTTWWFHIFFYFHPDP